MNFIHVGDLSVFKEPPSKPEPINLDRVLHVSPWSNGSYHRIYFKMTDGNNVTWEFKNVDDFEIYAERVYSLLESNDISQMTKL